MADRAPDRTHPAGQARAHAGLPCIDRYGEAIAQLADWVRAGKIRYREEILPGLESAPDAIAGLYRGENLGRRLISLV